MRVLLEFGPNLGIFAYCFSSFLSGLIRMRVLFEGGSLSRIYGILPNDYRFNDVANTVVNYKNYIYMHALNTVKISNFTGI